jgi:hypothetical protein
VFTAAPLAWVNDLGSFPVELGLPLLRSGGYGAIVVQVNDGTTPVALDAGRARQYHQAGLAVLGWGWAKGDDPEGEAMLAASRVRVLGLDGYILNAEKPYDGIQGGVFDQAHYDRSARFCSRWDRTLPLGVSTEPRTAMRHEEWQALGAAYMPQAYPQENRATIADVVEFGRSVGWDAHDIVPLAGCYVHDGATFPASEHHAAATRAGVNVCLYYADGLLNEPAQWTGLVGR